MKRNFISNDICVDFHGGEASASSPTVPAVLSVNVMRGFGEGASLLPFNIMLVIIFNSYTHGACVSEKDLCRALISRKRESRKGNGPESGPEAQIKQQQSGSVKRTTALRRCRLI